ncbi:MAG: YdcF family protein [Bacteroidota bacterium]|nr:YdcF family protein [Bacteroidota bacterium]
MTKKRILISLTVLILGVIAIIFICNKKIVDNAEGKLYSETNTIPFNKVGLLLGTSKFLKSGTENPYYTYRIEATLKLIADSKIKYVIISGDNGTKKYNEPEMMRSDLIKGGIDSAHIILDYAGFRTFDSMVRLKEIFGQSSVTVISQQFHNERAIYTGDKLGITTIGFNAKDVSTTQGLKTQLREKLARVKVFLDFMFGNQVKFLGSKIEIPS